MRQHQKMHRFSKTIMAGLITGGALLAQPALAQLSSATIRGQITQSGAPAKTPVQIIATNKATGATYRATTQGDGSYVLIGMAPGSYNLSVVGSKEAAQEVTVQVGETASIDLALSVGADAATLDRVQVVGSLQRKDVKTSEVGTSVSRAQIENLPQVTRNFLAFADLAPGVRFDVDAQGFVKMQSGAQNQDNINIFIDGVSQKNNILRGGASGMDSTRGNPFPQSAIAEYKVISQNYKAEFDQVSSAAITAVTKSGGNELHGDVFWDHTGNNLTAYSPFEAINKANGSDRANFNQEQYGFTLGGPIKEDVAHYFFSYEGKDIAAPRNVGLASVASLLPNAGMVPSFLAMQGSHNQTFKENLLFAKVDLQLSPDSRLEISGRLRHENDFIAEDAGLSAPGNDKNRTNDETRFDVKHEWTGNTIFNEARFGYEQYHWSPNANTGSPEIRYFISPTNTQANIREFLRTGGSPDTQDKKQTGFLFQDDATYTGLSGHTIKAGAKLKFLTYDLAGTRNGVDIYQKLIDNVTGLPQTFAGNDYFQLDSALPSVGGKYKNNQFGIYLQDDWTVSKQLELNLGVRWDYESNMLNNSYVTPADRVASFNAIDTRAGAAPGQTYGQSLANGGININDYISTGSSRTPFTGALAPRLGFSYDLNGDKNMVAFGGFGRAYDRTIADNAIAELQNNFVPGRGDVFLIKNNNKQAFTDQFSLGLRKGVGVWNTEVGYTYSHAQNQFEWFQGNRDPLGGTGDRSPNEPLWGGPAGYGNLVLGDFGAEAKTQTGYLKADKPYTKASGWGFGITYTYSDATTTRDDLTNSPWNWTANRATSGFNRSIDVERHRIVASGVTDGVLPWGILLSAKATLGSGLPYRINDFAGGWDGTPTPGTPGTGHYVAGEGKAFRQIDLGVGKEVAAGMGKFVLRMDVINLFNTVNYGSYDEWAGGPGNPQNYLGGDNPNLGTPTAVGGPMRTVKLSMRYAF